MKTWFYGIKDIEFIYHGDWNDPEIRYKGYSFNYYALEDCLYQDYLEDVDYNEYKQEFEQWIKEHDYVCYEYLDNFIVNKMFYE